MSLRIKDVAKEKGIALKDVADRMGISAIGLSQHINGNPSIEVLQRIADALEVHISDLFERPDGNHFRCPKCGVTLEIKVVEQYNVIRSR